MKKLFQIYFITLAILITGSFSVLLAVLQRAKVDSSASINTQVQRNLNSRQSSASTWQTYTDDRDGFSLSYPSTWKIDHGTAVTGNDRGVWLYFESSPSKRYQLNIFVSDNPKNLSAEDWAANDIAQFEGKTYAMIGKVQIGNNQGYAITDIFVGTQIMRLGIYQ